MFVLFLVISYTGYLKVKSFFKKTKIITVLFLTIQHRSCSLYGFSSGASGDPV